MSVERPQVPKPPAVVREFLAEQTCVAGYDSLRARDDAPPELDAWLDEMEAWKLAVEAWELDQPVSYAGDRDEWRMFGGPWLRSHEMLDWIDAHGNRIVHHVRTMVQNLPATEQRRFAEMFYQQKAAHERALRVLGDWYLDREDSGQRDPG